MSAQHTPLPWALSYGYALSNGSRAVYVAGSEPSAIGIKLQTPWIESAWDGDEEAEANARFIVRAVNSHYELLEALEAFVDGFDPDKDYDATDAAYVLFGEKAKIARAAIRKAKGESA